MTVDRLTQLAIKSVWPENDARVQGSVPEFTPQEIALGVAHCNRIGGSILLHKYVFNQITAAQAPEFYREVWDLAIQMAIKHGWDDGPKGERWYRRIAHAALYEILAPDLNCPACHGTKFLGTRPCHICDATGRTTISNEERGEAIGIPSSAWDRGKPPWSWRYEMVFRSLMDKQGSAARQLQAALGDLADESSNEADGR